MKSSYLFIISGLLLELIRGVMNITIPGIGWISSGLLLYGLFLLYKNKSTRPKGTAVGHSLSGIVLVSMGAMFFFFALVDVAVLGPKVGYSLSAKVLGGFGLITLLLGLYSFVRASKKP